MRDLNPKQLEAVEHTEGPLLILAGAGSGKTRVLTHRIAHLISSKKVNPTQILAVTFTNKAAAEMKGRVERLLGGATARNMWVATFHSACLRILRRHVADIGYRGDFSVYDDQDQLQVIQLCLKELNLDPKGTPPRSIAYQINRLKHDGLATDRYSSLDLDPYQQQTARLYALYQKKLVQSQAMDFGDLILNVVLLFRKMPEVLEYYRRFFSYLHVDEYQDTNRCQYELIGLLAGSHRNLCVVGDDDQSIYKFRGADIKNILDFQKDYPDAFVIRLEQNYRSTQTILKAASMVIKNNRSRMGKTLWTTHVKGEAIGLYTGETERDEALFVVSEVKNQRHQYLLDEMAIFYRTHAQSRSFEDALRREGLPYVIFGGMRFYERQEIKDVLAYLRVISNSSDAVSLRRIINVPARGLGRTTIERLEAISSHRGITLWELIIHETLLKDTLTEGTRQKLKHFTNLIRDLVDQKNQRPLVDFVSYLYEKTGYVTILREEKTLEAQSRLENLEEFLNGVKEFAEQASEASLDNFLDQSSLRSDLDDYAEGAKRLPLMTFHLAKGLEFPVVFMVGMEEGLFPHSRALDSDEELEEERRLCYVGMTRAKERLHLSFVRQRYFLGGHRYGVASRFLDEIDPELIRKIGGPRKEYSAPYVREVVDHPSPDPFDQRHEYEMAGEMTFRRGIRVCHPVFGMGTILSCEGRKESQKLTIHFSTGQKKKILAKYANLKVL